MLRKRIKERSNLESGPLDLGRGVISNRPLSVLGLRYLLASFIAQANHRGFVRY